MSALCSVSLILSVVRLWSWLRSCKKVNWICIATFVVWIAIQYFYIELEQIMYDLIEFTWWSILCSRISWVQIWSLFSNLCTETLVICFSIATSPTHELINLSLFFLIWRVFFFSHVWFKGNLREKKMNKWPQKQIT